MKKDVVVSRQNVFRFQVLEQVRTRLLTQSEAGIRLGLSSRQIRRLLGKVEQKGVEGLTHGLQGQHSNHTKDHDVLDMALSIVALFYSDFGPVLAAETLLEHHHIHIPLQTLRRAMIAENLWKVRRQRKVTIHPLRQRRACEGELVQIDGSLYAWFEERSTECVLLVAIDDATGKLKQLVFVQRESTWSYFTLAKTYLSLYGKPVCWYMDNHAVFRVNSTRGKSGAVEDGTGQTQFGRAMEELGIGCIFAATPQAKGRVERANQTLQDRLVKFLRLRGVSTMEGANSLMDIFMEKFNQHFSVKARSEEDAHQPLSPKERSALDTIFSLQWTRVLSRNLTFSLHAKLYQVVTLQGLHSLIHARIRIHEQRDGALLVFNGKRKILVEEARAYFPAERLTSKEVNEKVNTLRHAHTPSPTHPWRRTF